MKFFEKTKGSVSIFLILVLTPLFTCSYLAADIARYSSAKTKVNGALDLTGNAALAEYNRTLKALYGIFAMSSSKEELGNSLRACFSGTVDAGESLEMFDKLSVEYDDKKSLSNTDVFEREILDYMKYRAPFSLADGAMQKLSFTKQAKPLTKIYRNVTKYLDAVSKIDKTARGVFDAFPNEVVSGDTIITPEERQLTLDSLRKALSELPTLSKALEGTEKDSKKLKESIDNLSDGEMKSLLKSEYSSFLDVLTQKSVNELQKAIEKDIRVLEGSDYEDPEKETPPELSVKDLGFYSNPLYKYLSGSKEKENQEEKQTQAEALETIANTKLSDLYEVSEETKSLAISQMIEDDIFNALEGTTAESKGSSVKNAYITEYLSGMFTCATTKVGDKNLLGKEYKDRAYLPFEMEYIVFGQDGLSANSIKSMEAIFGIRLALNSVYAFSNTSMRQSAMSLAAATLPAGGASVALRQNLILLAWSMGESVLDVSSLCKGITVPLYKSSSTWTLSLSNAPQILADGTKSFVCNEIDDVFSGLSNGALESVDKITEVSLGYIEKTGKSATESITAIIMTPIEKKISEMSESNLLSLSARDIEKQLMEALSSTDSDSKAIKMAKEIFIAQCLPILVDTLILELPALASDNASVAQAASERIKSEIMTVYDMLFEKVSVMVYDLEKEAKTELENIANNSKETAKSEAKKAIDKYTESLGSYMGGDSISSSSGIGMTYTDYLKALAFMKLSNNGERSKLLKRALYVMQINCEKEAKAKNQDFDIRRCYTTVNINARVKRGLHKIEKQKQYSY